jgi:hypothetical protein
LAFLPRSIEADGRHPGAGLITPSARQRRQPVSWDEDFEMDLRVL